MISFSDGLPVYPKLLDSNSTTLNSKSQLLYFASYNKIAIHMQTNSKKNDYK